MGLVPGTVLAGPPQAYQTYVLRQQPDVTVPAACSDVSCEAWLHGWESRLDETDGTQAQMAAWLRSGASGRTFREMGRDETGRTVFRFDARQRCFTDHETIPGRLLVVHGDWRRSFGVTRRHSRAADWIDDQIENCDRVWSRIARG